MTHQEIQIKETFDKVYRKLRSALRHTREAEGVGCYWLRSAHNLLGQAEGILEAMEFHGLWNEHSAKWKHLSRKTYRVKDAINNHTLRNLLGP